MVGKLVRFLFVIFILAAIGFVIFAYIGDLDPTQERVTEPVELEFSR
ncbi:MAG: hypothetical protein AAF646_15270 [Pseudomonadota bacterium]